MFSDKEIFNKSLGQCTLGNLENIENLVGHF